MNPISHDRKILNGKDKQYHINKLNECNSQGISLIQIFEDELVSHRQICENKIKQICYLNTNLPRIFDRKCSVQKIMCNNAKTFLESNHIQGFARTTVHLDCFYENELVGVMTLKRERNNNWDLNRFATNIAYQCVGIGGKLFTYFTTHYVFNDIKSFANRRWTLNINNNLYTKRMDFH